MHVLLTLRILITAVHWPVIEARCNHVTEIGQESALLREAKKQRA